MLNQTKELEKNAISLPLYINNETVFERKGCDKCDYLNGYISWWCTNKEAIKVRGTSIPGIRHCDYWLPDYNRLTKEEKNIMEEKGYKKPKLLHRIFG